MVSDPHVGRLGEQGESFAGRCNGMIRSVRNILRLLAIARTLARHDALFLLETLGVAPTVVLAARLISRRREAGRPGERLARAFQEAGPSFIKLGQALSTRSDLLGETLTADLSQLQDRLAPFSGTEARAIIEAQLGAPMASAVPAVRRRSRRRGVDRPGSFRDQYRRSRSRGQGSEARDRRGFRP